MFTVGGRLNQTRLEIEDGDRDNILFLNEPNFWEKTNFFVNEGVVHKKRTMDKRLGSFTEIKNFRFLKTKEKLNDLKSLEGTCKKKVPKIWKAIVFYWTKDFFEQTLKKTWTNNFI